MNSNEIKNRILKKIFTVGKKKNSKNRMGFGSLPLAPDQKQLKNFERQDGF